MLCDVTTLIIRLEKVRLSKTLCGEKRRVQEIEKRRKEKTFNFE